MAYLKTFLLGIIQGLTEFLPVSSSGHLVLFQRIFNMPETGLLLEILLHVGTLVAVLVMYWDDWWMMLRHPFKDPTVRLLLIATVPAVVVALLFDDLVEKAFSGWFLGIGFLITSILLICSDWLKRRSGKVSRQRYKGVQNMLPRQALAMGIMQAVAIVPGISRSGSTIVGGLASGVNRRTAAKFSFMMSAIATLGSLVFKFKDLIGVGGAAFDGGMVAAAIGMVAAGVSGFLAMRLMMRLIQRVSLKWFGFYTAVLGMFILMDQFFFGLVFPKFF